MTEREYRVVEYRECTGGKLTQALNEDAEKHPEATLMGIIPIVKDGNTVGFLGWWQVPKEVAIRDYVGFGKGESGDD